MIHKCYLLGLVDLSPGIQRQNIVQKNQTERVQQRVSHVICKLYFGVVCGLIDKLPHVEKLIIIII